MPVLIYALPVVGDVRPYYISAWCLDLFLFQLVLDNLGQCDDRSVQCVYLRVVSPEPRFY